MTIDEAKARREQLVDEINELSGQESADSAIEAKKQEERTLYEFING